MAELLSLYGVETTQKRPRFTYNTKPTLLENCYPILTYRQHRMMKQAELMGEIPIDSIITGVSNITSSIVGAVSAAKNSAATAAANAALQQAQELAQARQTAALKTSQNTSVTLPSGNTIPLKNILLIGVPVALLGITAFLKLRRRK